MHWTTEWMVMANIVDLSIMLSGTRALSASSVPNHPPPVWDSSLFEHHQLYLNSVQIAAGHSLRLYPTECRICRRLSAAPAEVIGSDPVEIRPRLTRYLLHIDYC